jgi:hypothetical protein
MTTDELQSIVTQVISAIRTNSKTIDQLSAVESLGDGDYFEVNGGRKVAYATLRDLIASLSTTEQDSIKTLINKNVLKSVSFTVGESTATLSISSAGKTIECEVPIASDTSSGFITAADKLRIKAAYDLAETAKNNSVINANNITDVTKRVTTLESTTVPALQDDIDAVVDSVGAPEGIAPLDSSQLIPTAYLPAEAFDVKEFKAFVENVAVATEGSPKKSTDTNCSIVFDEANNRFLLDVLTSNVGTSSSKASSSTLGSDIDASGVVTPAFSHTYYNTWVDSLTTGGGAVAGKIYVCTSTNTTYRWNGSAMVKVGSSLELGHDSGTAFPGDEGTALSEQVASIKQQVATNTDNVDALLDKTATNSDLINSIKEQVATNTNAIENVRVYPCNGTWSGDVDPGSGVYLITTEDGVKFASYGSTDWYGLGESAYNKDGLANEDNIYQVGSGLYHVVEGKLVSLEGSAVGNCFNLTAALPLTDEAYYNMNPTSKYYAPNYVISENKAALGLQITFAVADGSWKTYQYIGNDLTTENVKNLNNWLDLAALSAGDEAILNINALLDTPNKAYTPSTAIDRLNDKQAASGITYIKKGLIITFISKRDDDNGDTWTTMQFIANPADFDSNLYESQWKEFGGGGSANVEVTDTPTEGSTKAFSAAGAYALQSRLNKAIFNLDKSEDSENIIVQGLDYNNAPIGSVITIPKGSGGQQGSTLTLFFEDASPIGAYGGSITTRAAFKSVSYDGDTEILGTILKVEILNEQGLVLKTEEVNTKSSASAADMKFTLDFTDYFTEAATSWFTIRVTDADGNTKTRDLKVKAVDVTVTVSQSTQPLNYSSTTALTEGSNEAKFISLYKFAKQTEEIFVTVDMFYKGEWRQLTTATIKNRNTQGITINPCDVFGGGEQLTHGAYPLRIQGQDTNSGVKGNIVYTAVMVVNSALSTPIVAMRYNDAKEGKVRLYDNVVVEVAAYTPGQVSTNVTLMTDGEDSQEFAIDSNAVVEVSKQVQGYQTDGSDTIRLQAKSGGNYSYELSLIVEGSAIDVALKTGAKFSFDFSTRSNSESDHSISNNGYTMTVNGSNYSSNGFVSFLGENCLRIAENVTAEMDYQPFGNSAVEQTGMALQFAFATKNIKDPDAKLMQCIDETSGVGFYITGNEAVLFCAKGVLGEDKFNHRIKRSFKCSEKITMAIVVEPSSNAVEHDGVSYSTIKMYINGEEVGAIGYIPDTNSIYNTKNISFDGTKGDFYLYYVLPYDTYYGFVEAFDNYLCKLTDTDAMITEYESEDVLNEQSQPSMSKLSLRSMPYYVVVADKDVFDKFDSDVNTSTKFSCTLYYYHPTKPWRSFKATNVQWRRQGTTSAKRPIKNDRFYLAAKKAVDYPNVKVEVTALYPDYTNDDALITYQLFNINKVRVGENTLPVDIITVKVDYSDSSNANDCGVCDMMNATFRALGSEYMTPAQRAYDGTWTKGDVKLTGLQMNHSTANHPIIVYRATLETLSDVYFHAKGNWKEDKGEQVALGFKDTPGYNLGCINYGDFTEYFGQEGETLDEIETRFKKESSLNTSTLYLLSLYCGRDYRFMRYTNGAWEASTGSMKQVNGKWVITGDVLNPVSGYELLTYSELDWWQGVSSVEEMMAPINVNESSSWAQKLKSKLNGDTVPKWTQYFECMVDDDQLQIDLANGKKVPYELFNVLRFCSTCDYSTIEAFKEIWKANAYKYMSIHSLMSYYTFTDYLAAVDQQAKNMQPMFFLEDGCSVENGVYSSGSSIEPIRMYFNKVYDCDTCNSKDNDGGNTIPADVDPGKDFENDTRYYAGRGSILWVNLRAQQTMQYADGDNYLTLTGVVDKMRNATTTVDGKTLIPFSPEGANYFFVEQRIKQWPKKISSYDGERKYLNYSNVTDLYFYALQGLGLTSLPAFIEQRWRSRDGVYQTGSFKDAAHVISGRVGSKSGAVIKFKAAKSGYFAIGNDGANATQGMYLEAGEEGVFDTFQHGDNVLLYLYQVDLMSEIDLSQITLSGQWKFSSMSLIEKLILGSEDHADWLEATGNAGSMTDLTLGDLPFLRVLDIRNTEVSVVNASSCPRLEELYALGSPLSDLTIAETAPIDVMQLPATLTGIKLQNLPNLSYPGGLTFEGLDKLQSLVLSNCPNIDSIQLLSDVLDGGALTYLRMADLNVTAPASLLEAIKNNGVVGLDPNGKKYSETNQCSGLTGRWIIKSLVEDSLLKQLQNYFPELKIYNQQFSTIRFDDTVADAYNITNLDNNTGYGTDSTYAPSGHFSLIDAAAHAYKCLFNSKDGKMYCTQLSDSTYLQLANGDSFDPADIVNIGYDVMKLVPGYWYKGINDFKNQHKYMLASSYKTEPISTATKITRQKLSECRLVQAQAYLYASDMEVGGDISTVETASMNVYEVDVDGMKQVRWPGVNSAQICAVFLDEDDKVLSIFTMQVTNTLFDFTYGDYVFTDVPVGAKKLMFTSPVGYDDVEVIAVDSAELEAIEPDWVWHHPCLTAVYGGSIDSLGQLRSLSGAKTVVGTGTAENNSEWTYDSDGNVTNKTIPTSTMNYTYMDYYNLAQMRGAGFQLIDYEMSKDIANLVYAMTGTRDIQALCGYGSNVAYTTGSWNSYGNKTQKQTNTSQKNGNLIWGFQNFVGCNWEPMDNAAMNVVSWVSFKKNKRTMIAADVVDDIVHVYSPETQSERTIQGYYDSSQASNSTYGYNIARVKFGRYCDILPSKTTTDTTKFNQYYCDGYWYYPLQSTGYGRTKGRVLGRSVSSADANGGLAYTSASNFSSHSGTSTGARLAFRGEIVITDSETAA